MGFNEYDIIRRLGSGNMGEVYLVRSRRLSKEYAMKVYSEGNDAGHRQAILNENEKLKAINDRRIPYVVDCFEENGKVCMVTEYLEGVNFEEYLCENAPLPANEAITYFKEICDIMRYLHNYKPAIILGDLKPSNLMLCNNHIRLFDFGTAVYGNESNAAKARIYGTYGYCSPEMSRDGIITEGSDVYSMGAILYYMVSGHNPAMPPFEIGNLSELISFVPGGIIELIRHCTDANVQKRYRDAAELYENIDTCEKNKGINNFANIIYDISLILLLILCLYTVYCDFYIKQVEIVLNILSIIMGIILSVMKGIMFSVQLKRNFYIRRRINIICSDKKYIGLNYHC